VGVTERDEWLRAAWRVAVAGALDPRRRSRSWTRWVLTPRFLRCTPIPHKGHKGLRAGPEKPRGEHRAACERESGGNEALPGGGTRHNRHGLRGLHRAEDRRRIPRPVARLFGRDPEKLCASDREYMRKLGGLNSEVERAYELPQGFSRMLRVRRHLEMLDGWLEKASPADRPSCAALPKVCAATTAPFARLLEALEQRADRRPAPPPQALKEADVR
jgi:hypothetical protein